VGSGTVWVFSAAMLQMIVPDQYRGRVFSTEFALLTLTQSISIFVAGYLLDTAGFDTRQVTVVSAATAAIVTVLWAIFYFANVSSDDLDKRISRRQESSSADLV